MRKIKKVLMTSAACLFLFMAITGYCESFCPGSQDSICKLRVPLISYEMGKRRGALKRLLYFLGGSRENKSQIQRSPDISEANSPWRMARDSKGRLIPLFIAESHVSTYYVVEKAIKEGFLDPEKTVVINFDQHPDNVPIINASKSVSKYSFVRSGEVCFNNWPLHLLKNKMISSYHWINNPSTLAMLDIAALKGKHIVISIDIDYFDWFKERNISIENGIEEVVNFIRGNNLDIKVISMAYSHDWCRVLTHEEIIGAADSICRRMNVELTPSLDARKDFGINAAQFGL